MDRVELAPCGSACEQELLSDIAAFWRTHHAAASPESVREDLALWTGEGHELYVILEGGEPVGFLHLGSRGGECDWLEDIFVREDRRGRGIGSRAVELAWALLEQRGLETMYLEVVPSNVGALRLYHRLGFCNLNTLTLNRSKKEKQPLGSETISGMTFRTYRPNQG